MKVWYSADTDEAQIRDGSDSVLDTAEGEAKGSERRVLNPRDPGGSCPGVGSIVIKCWSPWARVGLRMIRNEYVHSPNASFPDQFAGHYETVFVWTYGIRLLVERLRRNRDFPRACAISRPHTKAVP